MRYVFHFHFQTKNFGKFPKNFSKSFLLRSISKFPSPIIIIIPSPKCLFLFPKKNTIKITIITSIIIIMVIVVVCLSVCLWFVGHQNQKTRRRKNINFQFDFFFTKLNWISWPNQLFIFVSCSIITMMMMMKLSLDTSHYVWWLKILNWFFSVGSTKQASRKIQNK